MTACCQFCGQIISGSECSSLIVPRNDAEAAEISDRNYANLAGRVMDHMTGAHDCEPVTREIMAVMYAASSTVAMRYVSSSDNRVEGHRLQVSQRLMESFNTAPVRAVDTVVSG